MLWLDRLVGYASLLLNLQKDSGAEPKNANLVEGGRFGPGCVYRGGERHCPPFQANQAEHQPVSYTGDQRPCYDINVSVETFYQFIPVTTETTETVRSTSRLTSSFTTVQTESTKTFLSTESVASEITTTVSVPFFSSITITFVTTATAIGTTTTISNVVTGSVDVGTSSLTTILTSVPFITVTDITFITTEFPTTVTITSVSTLITSFQTDAFAAAITIGPNQKDWSYFYNSCQNVTYDGDGSYTGGPLISTDSSSNEPLFISSNKRFRLYPCETMEVSAAFSLAYSGPQNITSPLGYESDPAYGAGLMGAYDLDTGFSFYLITTAHRAYALYSRVPSWCPCVNVTSTAKPCGSCRGLDLADDRLNPVPTPRCDPCGDTCAVQGQCDPCGCGAGGNCASILYTMSTQTFPEPTEPISSTVVPVTTSSIVTSDPTTPLPIGKAAPRRELQEKMAVKEKGGFEYFSFTYLIPIDYLIPGQQVRGSILLNKGEPSVTWTVNGKPRLTIKNVGQSIDPRFMLAQYGGSADFLDFPSYIQMALGLLSVTESTDGRTACQGGVYEECYQGGQSIQDARYTFCNRAPIQDPRTYNLSMAMEVEKLGLARITKTPRPCCPNYA